MDIFDPDSIDFYNWNELEKLHERRAKKWLKLLQKIEKGDPRANEAMKKHEEEDRILRERARRTGFYWT